MISVLCVLFTSSCSGTDKSNGEQLKDKIVTEIPADNITEIPIQEITQNKTDEVWEEAEDSELYYEKIDYTDVDSRKAFPEDIDQRLSNLAEKVQGDFVAVNYKHKEIPNSLIVLAEKALFERDMNQLNFNTSSYEISKGDFYDTFGHDYYASKGEFEIQVSHIYKYQLDHNTYYLEVAYPGGTTEIVSVTIYKESDGELTVFDFWNCMDIDARVIEYKDVLYFIDSSFSYYYSYLDEINILKLVPERIKEYVSVKLLPIQFEWEEIYNNHQTYEKSISTYIDSIKDDLMDKSIIDDSIQVYIGDETRQFDDDKKSRLKSVCGDDEYYEIDFNNDGGTEYIERFYYNIRTWYIINHIYKFSEENIISIGGNFDRDDGTLLQLWFKEIEGKVYTFRLFLKDGYNYYLNVSLVENTNVTQVLSYLIATKKEFEISTQMPPHY